MSNTELNMTLAETWRLEAELECVSQGVSGLLAASPAISLRGTSVPASGSGMGTGAVAAVAAVLARPQALRVRPQAAQAVFVGPQGADGQHGKPAANQHFYNYNPAASGDGAVGAVGPPHREPV